MDNYIGARVGYLDFFGVPHTGKVVYQKPHNTDSEIMYFGIELDEEQNEIPITDSGQVVAMVGEYRRSDEVSLLE